LTGSKALQHGGKDEEQIEREREKERERKGKKWK